MTKTTKRKSIPIAVKYSDKTGWKQIATDKDARIAELEAEVLELQSQLPKTHTSAIEAAIKRLEFFSSCHVHCCAAFQAQAKSKDILPDIRDALMRSAELAKARMGAFNDAALDIRTMLP